MFSRLILYCETNSRNILSQDCYVQFSDFVLSIEIYMLSDEEYSCEFKFTIF